MITKLSIANFKSIRQLDIDCKKINVFIGEPNTGKSNILKLSPYLVRASRSLGDYVRFELWDLFSDGLVADKEILYAYPVLWRTHAGQFVSRML
jgi:AAA15 family ATPase/GTPase